MSPVNWNVLNLSSGGAYLKSLYPDGLAQSQVFTSVGNTGDPGLCASRKYATLAGNGEECWKLTRPLSQHAALIEAACFGATLRSRTP